MKRKTIMVIMLMSMMGLTACQASETKENGQTSSEVEVIRFEDTETNTETDTEGTESTQTDTTEEKTDGSVSSEMTDNFSVAPKDVADYAASIQEAVSQKDMEKLADLTAFPVYVGLEGVDVVDTREDFLALDSSAVFSEEMCSVIEQADASGLEASRAGFTLMGEEGPSITFGVVNGELRITGINY